MKDKPQLSAEMEKRFDKEFGYLSVAIDYYVENAYPLRKESGMKHLRDIKQFLVTALEEQRAEMMKKVVELNKKWGAVPNDFRHWHQELVESLNGKDNHE